MNFLKNNRRFDFLYGGKPFAELTFETKQIEEGNTLTTVYTLPDGLKITNIATRHGDAYEWVNWFENTSDTPSEILSDLYDTHVALPLPYEKYAVDLQWPASDSPYWPSFEEITSVYAPSGSVWGCYEFSAFPDRRTPGHMLGRVPCGGSRQYGTSDGLSSKEHAPFFNIHCRGVGYIVAVGWTGQWNCAFHREPEHMLVKAKIEDAHFRLLPGEKIRTSSFVVMPYEGSLIDAHNKWRRLIKKDFSLIGQPGRPEQGPLCAVSWGGMTSSSVLKRLDIYEEKKLPYEYIWMDAGWYGIDTKPSLDEIGDDWQRHAGDWRISTLIHPNQLKDVTQAIHESGKKFLLWFSPEWALSYTPVPQAHPEYFIAPEDPKNDRLLLDLGNPDAWNYCYNTLANLIESIDLDCYRQDMNIDPLAYWRKNDAPDRRGITEIKHIMGLYRLWDSLLERFPHLIIDNCAGGGRRIDVETLRRSIPLWRSDFQCVANFPGEGSQCHTLGYNLWMPYSGTGSGRMYDTYVARSSYGAAFGTVHTFSDRETFGDDPVKMAWLKARLEEYLRIRPYFSEDFYPLTEISDRRDTWAAWQFHSPEKQSGVVQVFRREKSPYETAAFALGGVDADRDYLFTDLDDNSQVRISGETLVKQGFAVTVKEKYTAKIFLYEQV